MADEHTGGMIALIPRAEDAERLRVPGGEKADELHLTLAYLGDDITGMPNDLRNTIVAYAAAVAAGLPQVDARVFGHAVFNPDGFEGREPCSVYLTGQSPAIDMLRQSVMEQIPPDIRALQLVPFVPHITARYGVVKRLVFTGPVVFDRLLVKFGGEGYHFPLGDTDEKALDQYRIEIKGVTGQGDAGTIGSIGDLKRVIYAFGNARNKAATKKMIIQRARALNATNLLPKGWLEGKVASDAELNMLIEEKIMSPSPSATRLREYWAHGEGRGKWHDWDSLRRQLGKYIQNPRILDGLTANIYKLATGQWPGRRGGEKSMAIITAEELKAAALLADPDADLSDIPDLPDDGETETGDEDAIYEQALVDEVEWDVDADGEPVREDEDGDTAGGQQGDISVSPGPRPSMASLFD